MCDTSRYYDPPETCFADVPFSAPGTREDLDMNSSVRTSVHVNCVLLIDAEFDFRVVGDGRSATARYANNSNYRNDSLIRKESGLATAMFDCHC